MGRHNALDHSSVETNIVDFKTGKNIKRDSKPVICERIRYYREKKGIEQKALSLSLGLTSNAVCNWESGKYRPDVDMLPTLCKKLDISFYQLYDLPDPTDQLSQEEKKIIGNYRKLTPAHQRFLVSTTDSLIEAQKPEQFPEIKKLILFDQQLAAGIGDPSEFEDKGTSFYSYVTPLTRRADYLFYVNGESMQPDYYNGDLVLVTAGSDRSLLRTGDIGAFMVGNELYIKQFMPDGLYSSNPAYAPIKFSDYDSVTLIGKVLGKLEDSNVVNEEDLERYKELNPDFA